MRVLAFALVLVPCLAHADPDAPLKPGVATALATAGTVVGIGLVASDHASPAQIGIGLGLLVVGPSAGHLYARDRSHAVVGMLVRGAGVGLTLLGLYREQRAIHACDDSVCEPGIGWLAVAWAGMAIVTGSGLHDLFDAHRAVERENRLRLYVSPTVVPSGAGFAVCGRF